MGGSSKKQQDRNNNKHSGRIVERETAKDSSHEHVLTRPLVRCLAV